MTRHYGLNIGDKVESLYNPDIKGEIIDFGTFDNNCCIIKLEDNTVIHYVCEWCKKLEN